MIIETKFGKFELVNEEKVYRAKFGNERIGGVGEDPDKIIVEYDKLGGLIRDEQGNNVQNGTFFDFKLKKPVDEPKIAFAQKKQPKAPVTYEEPEDKEVKKKSKKSK